MVAHKGGSVTTVLSSPRLISFFKYMKCIHIDATYKLVWQGHPVLIFGGSDAHKVFHPYAIAVLESEVQPEISYILKEFKRVSLVLSNQNFSPECLISDAAASIKNAFLEIFGKEKKVRMCWAHVIRNIDKKLCKIKLDIHRNEIRSDIVLLQISSSEKEFDISYNLFRIKWIQVNDESIFNFLNYFENTWINHNKHWYEGYCLFTPSTNNCLESVNLRVKQDHTLRERIPLSRFLKVLEDLVCFWSKERNPVYADCKKAANLPNLSFEQMLNAKRITDIYNIDFSENGDTCIKKHAQFDVHSLKMFNDNHIYSIKNFEEWRDLKENLSVVKKQDNIFVCTCKEFLKNYACMHCIASSFKRGAFIFPKTMEDVRIGEKRKRGRPQKANSGECLIRN